MNWHDLVPYQIAQQQLVWERVRRFAYAKQQGAISSELAKRVRVSNTDYKKYRDRESPVVNWLEDKDEINHVRAKLLKKAKYRLIKLSKRLRQVKRKQVIVIPFDKTKIECLSICE